VDVLIDLDAAPPPATTGRSRLRLPRPSHRALILLALALTLVIPASAARRPPPLTRLFSLSMPGNAAYVLHDQVLYAGGDTALAAYQLPHGRARWQIPTGAPVQTLTLVDRAGALVALLNAGASTTLASYDLTTGALLWQRPDLAARPVPGTGKLLAVRYGGGQAGGGQEMDLLDARTGAVTWQRSAPADGALIPGLRGPGQAGPVLAVARESGLQVEIFDVASGRTLVSGSLAQRVPALAQPLQQYTVNVVGRVLVVAAVSASGTTAYGFDAGTLAPLWRSPLASAAIYANDCATVICLYGDGGTVTLNPVTGAVLGFADWRDVTPLTPDWLLAQRDTEAVVGRDLVSTLDLVRWRALGGGQLTVLGRPDQGGTWVAILEPRAPAVHPIGLVPLSALESATTDGRYLVCRVSGRGLIAYTLV
jgi:outer membrane protein assembly factor BamB